MAMQIAVQSGSKRWRWAIAAGATLAMALAMQVVISAMLTSSDTPGDLSVGLPNSSLQLQDETGTIGAVANGSPATFTPPQPTRWQSNDSASLHQALPLKPISEQFPSSMPRLGAGDDQAPWESWPSATNSNNPSSVQFPALGQAQPSTGNAQAPAGELPTAAKPRSGLRGVIQ